MRCGLLQLWLATLVGLASYSLTDTGHATNPRPSQTANEWKKGNKLSAATEQTVQLQPGTRVRLAANSTTEVLGKMPLPTSIRGLSPYADMVRLLRGRLDAAIDPKKGAANAVIVYGPRKTSVLVSSGQVSIVVADNGIAVGVYEGRTASVGIGATWKQIAAGKMLVVSTEHPNGFESPLPDTPIGVTVARPVIAVTGLGDPSRAVWQKKPEVTAYRVHLRNTQSDEHRYLETPEPSINLVDLTPGRYELSVAALAEFGLDGAYSAPTYVNVVGVELPPGGYFYGGKAFVEPGQQLKLSYIEGLEMTYDGASVYFNAVGRTGLRNGHASTFHLRFPGSQERASLVVMPRSLDAKVVLSPTLARWPRDKIRIVVQLPKGVIESGLVTVRTSVTVNNRPVELEWVRTANTLETVLIGPPTYPGPWVLRAEVTDQHGFVLGHNFLEIASMAGQNEEELPVEVHRVPLSPQAKR
jgi:hypothetical protein